MKRASDAQANGPKPARTPENKDRALAGRPNLRPLAMVIREICGQILRDYVQSIRFSRLQFARCDLERFHALPLRCPA